MLLRRNKVSLAFTHGLGTLTVSLVRQGDEKAPLGSTEPSAGDAEGGDDRVDEEEEDEEQRNLLAAQREKSATIIQSCYCRHRKRGEDGAGGPNFVTYNRLAVTVLEKGPAHSKPSQYAMHLRGPMPHVATYTKKLLDRCQSAITALQRQMLELGHENLDDLMIERQRGLFVPPTTIC